MIILLQIELRNKNNLANLFFFLLFCFPKLSCCVLPLLEAFFFFAYAITCWSSMFTLYSLNNFGCCSTILIFSHMILHSLLKTTLQLNPYRILFLLSISSRDLSFSTLGTMTFNVGHLTYAPCCIGEINSSLFLFIIKTLHSEPRHSIVIQQFRELYFVILDNTSGILFF